MLPFEKGKNGKQHQTLQTVAILKSYWADVARALVLFSGFSNSAMGSQSGFCYDQFGFFFEFQFT